MNALATSRRVLTALTSGLLAAAVLAGFNAPAQAQWQTDGVAQRSSSSTTAPLTVPTSASVSTKINGVDPRVDTTPIPNVASPSVLSSASRSTSQITAGAEITLMQYYKWGGSGAEPQTPPTANIKFSLTATASSTGNSYAYGASASGTYPKTMDHTHKTVTVMCKTGNPNYMQGTPAASATNIFVTSETGHDVSAVRLEWTGNRYRFMSTLVTTTSGSHIHNAGGAGFAGFANCQLTMISVN